MKWDFGNIRIRIADISELKGCKRILIGHSDSTEALQIPIKCNPEKIKKMLDDWKKVEKSKQ
jgi:hypothetical protein